MATILPEQNSGFPYPIAFGRPAIHNICCEFRSAAHRPVGGGLHDLGVLAEHAAGVLRGVRHPAVLAGLQESDPSAISTSSVRLATSRVIGSPSRTNAIGPPSTASGAMWPTHSPVVPPENRPSVISRTSLPRPAPLMAPVIASISRIPGPPFGPS